MAIRAALASLSVAVAACGSPGIADEAVVQAVQQHLRGQGVTPVSIACPTAPALHHGQAVVCEAAVRGATLSIVVAVADAQGRLDVRPREPTIVVARAIEEIRAMLAPQGIVAASIDCDADVWVAAQGAEGTCTIVDEAGARHRYTATFSGEGARHRARIEPL